MSLLSYLIPRKLLESSSVYNKKIEVREINGRNILLVNGIQQTGPYTEKLWKKGLKNMHAKRILVFGIGGGAVLRHFPDSHITAVDIDPEIIRIAKKYFGLGRQKNVIIVQSDARLFRTIKKFDLVIVDLYTGNDVPNFVSQKEFLHRILGFVSPGGQLIINYFSQTNQARNAANIVSLLPGATAKPVLRNMFIFVVKYVDAQVPIKTSR